MKPQKKTATIAYWTCNNPDHRHKFDYSAQNCIDKHAISAEFDRNVAGFRRRNIKIATAWAKGETYTEISKRFDIGPGRVAGICQKITRILRHPKKAAGYPINDMNIIRGRLPKEYRERYLIKLDALSKEWS